MLRGAKIGESNQWYLDIRTDKKIIDREADPLKYYCEINFFFHISVKSEKPMRLMVKMQPFYHIKLIKGGILLEVELPFDPVGPICKTLGRPWVSSD